MEEAGTEEQWCKDSWEEDPVRSSDYYMSQSDIQVIVLFYYHNFKKKKKAFF